MKIFNKIPLEKPDSKLLCNIDTPSDYRSFSSQELELLADELREYLLYSVGQSGGHLGGGLGVVELTVVLHYIFNTPTDNLIWDVGHQAYPHKILTGRKAEIQSIRHKDGLAPFPNIAESEYDAFGVGHSSTSISAALGMAIASEKNERTVAVIGDGAMTAGMAFEALSHAGHLKPNMLVILNDNDMSISENIGGLSNYFSRIWASKVYKGIKKGGASFLKPLPQAYHLARKAETQMKAMVAPGSIFEELGFNYIGPIDGHNIKEMLEVIGNLKDFEGPQFLHIITKKGAGLDAAEADRIEFHAIGKINSLNNGSSSSIKYQDVFGEWIVNQATNDEKLIAITPAMREGSGLVEFSKKFPERYFDVAIAEQHSVTLAAGLACEGQKPIVCIYSTFLQRAYDQLIHDVALQNLDVLFAVDRSGFVGADGGTHNGSYDLSYLRCIPNMLIMAPSSEEECKNMLYTGYLHNGPAVVRYPRGEGLGEKTSEKLENYEIGISKKIRVAESIVILCFGSVLDVCLSVAEELNTSLFDMRFIKPIDDKVILDSAEKYSLIVTVEDNSIMGGAGSAVNEVLAKNNSSVNIINIGTPDRFFRHATREEQLKQSGVSKENILKRIKKCIKNNNLYDLNLSSNIKK